MDLLQEYGSTSGIVFPLRLEIRVQETLIGLCSSTSSLAVSQEPSFLRKILRIKELNTVIYSSSSQILLSDYAN